MRGVEAMAAALVTAKCVHMPKRRRVQFSRVEGGRHSA
jgi:hypothetical protein